MIDFPIVLLTGGGSLAVGAYWVANWWDNCRSPSSSTEVVHVPRTVPAPLNRDQRATYQHERAARIMSAAYAELLRENDELRAVIDAQAAELQHMLTRTVEVQPGDLLPPIAYAELSAPVDFDRWLAEWSEAAT